MIPKIIHYCWFGRQPKPQRVLDYIKTWQCFLPDFTIKEWNEENFDVNLMEYTKEAYFAKKYAFVSDVARLYALSREGGIYFDTDIKLVKRFSDELLNSNGFLGFEHEEYVTTGVMASAKNNPIITEIFNGYFRRSFFKGIKFDESTNVSYITNYFKQRGLNCNNQFQIFDGFLFLPQVYLCANDWRTRKFYNTEETYAIHEFSYTWANNGKIKKRLYQLATIIKFNFLSRI